MSLQLRAVEYRLLAVLVDELLERERIPHQGGGRVYQSAFGIFNLGESRTIALSRLIELIEEALGKKASSGVRCTRATFQ